LWRDLIDVSIKHCQKDADRVTHELARWGFSLNNNCIWVDGPPNFISKELVNDITILMNQ
jgi:hypothetical protein